MFYVNYILIKLEEILKNDYIEMGQISIRQSQNPFLCSGLYVYILYN